MKFRTHPFFGKLYIITNHVYTDLAQLSYRIESNHYLELMNEEDNIGYNIYKVRRECYLIRIKEAEYDEY